MEQKIKQNQTTLHCALSAGLMMETLVTRSADRQPTVPKTQQKKGTSRQSWRALHLILSVLPFQEFERAALPGSQHFIHDPLNKCGNSALSGWASGSGKQYEIIAIIM